MVPERGPLGEKKSNEDEDRGPCIYHILVLIYLFTYISVFICLCIQ